MEIQNLNPKVIKDLVRLLSIAVVVFMIATAIFGTMYQKAKSRAESAESTAELLTKAYVDCVIENTELESQAEEQDIEIYVTVKKGDWLSKYAKQYLGDPHRWPEIWKLNPHIKNPHLIYPGQEVRIQ